MGLKRLQDGTNTMHSDTSKEKRVQSCVERGHGLGHKTPDPYS